MNYKSIIVLAILLGLTACTNDTPPETTIMELMVTRVVPASDTIWGIEDPKTDEE